MSMEPSTTGNATVCNLGSLKIVNNIQKTVCKWIIIELKNWPEWLDEVKSRVFKDSASNKWCMAISRRGGILFVRFHLFSSQKESPKEAKIKISLISGNETMWQCREKIVNLNGQEKTISCGSFEYLKFNRFLEEALKLQGEVCLRRVMTEQYGNTKLDLMQWRLTNLWPYGRRPPSFLVTVEEFVCFLGCMQFCATIQKTVSTWTISDLKNWPQELDAVTSPIFRDSAQNEWYIGISGKTGRLKVCFYLVSSYKQISMKAKVKALLISKNKTIWESQEKNVNLNGTEKTFYCGCYEGFKQSRYFDDELKLHGEVRLRNVTVERYEGNRL